MIRVDKTHGGVHDERVYLKIENKELKIKGPPGSLKSLMAPLEIR